MSSNATSDQIGCAVLSVSELTAVVAKEAFHVGEKVPRLLEPYRDVTTSVLDHWRVFSNISFNKRHAAE
ncbi:hypothetical protein [Ralstonia sp. Ralssp135]|uniref:hypothetical protein n=1 Tax=Ralstonia sp. Ralssp135 TaxID=3243016 RepID=UPI0039AEA809